MKVFLQFTDTEGEDRSLQPKSVTDKLLINLGKFTNFSRYCESVVIFVTALSDSSALISQIGHKPEDSVAVIVEKLMQYHAQT